MKCPVCKKNIPDTVLRCPHCKARTGILCSNCHTVNSVENLKCKKCNGELFKICSHCQSVNYPNASKCRKCGSPFGEKTQVSHSPLEFIPNLTDQNSAYDLLIDALQSKDKKMISIAGAKGIGKTTLLKKVIRDTKFKWCIGKCTPLTQLTPGGVVQDMLLNLFQLPNYCINNDEFSADASKFFSNEFKFLNKTEVSDFVNFLYNTNDGDYEDIINNKKRTHDILNKVFDALCGTGKFVFVVDNLDFIDGFSIEFLANFTKRENNWKNLKFIAVYNEYKPLSAYFPPEKSQKTYLDIYPAPVDNSDLEKTLKLSSNTGSYVSKREKEIIFERCGGNPAFVEQAISYCFDCQFADKAFIMPKNFSDLIKERLETLKKINKEAYKLLIGASVLGDRLNLVLLKEIFGYKARDFQDIISYLVKSKFVRPYNESFYEFNNLLLWETVLKNIQRDKLFEDINVKIGRALSQFNINTNAPMAMIAHNLKENRMAFDIWTKLTRLSAYIGDINLYVISQKQCLALLNEFNENETLNIRYNISERLGKLLTEYNPEEAVEYLPDAISNAKSNNDETKEIDLLSYLCTACKKTGNYFGNIECVDDVLKKLAPSQDLECALIKASKLSSIISIGNCAQAINLIDNEILPVLNSNLIKPKLNNNIPLGLVYDTKIRTLLYLSAALALQGNDRSFEILTELFQIIEKAKITDKDLIAKAKLTLAWANTMKGNFQTSNDVLAQALSIYGIENSNYDGDDAGIYEQIQNHNLISAVNRFLQKDYEDLREELFEYTMFSQDSGSEFYKNIFKTLLGKLICDSKQAKRAMEIYNEQITFFAEKKLAFGALLTWYLIAEASMITKSPKSTIETASQALEIAQNPHINNYFFIVILKTLIAKAYMKLSDFESAKNNLESAVSIAKKYNMNDFVSKIYFIFGKYYQEIGTVNSQNQTEYLKGAVKMYDKALEKVNKNTRNSYLKNKIIAYKKSLETYCTNNGYTI